MFTDFRLKAQKNVAERSAFALGGCNRRQPKKDAASEKKKHVMYSTPAPTASPYYNRLNVSIFFLCADNVPLSRLSLPTPVSFLLSLSCVYA